MVGKKDGLLNNQMENKKYIPYRVLWGGTKEYN